jgi:hypothetical protein
MSLLDSKDGVRRMGQAEPGSFNKCLTFGRVTHAPISGFEDEPVLDSTVTFAPYVRIDAAEGTDTGDLIVGDIIHWLMRIFGCFKCPFDCCPPNTPRDLIVLNTRFDGGESEATVYQPLQAWTKTTRFLFKVVYQCCRPGQALYIT